jgi:uncharacterized protein
MTPASHSDHSPIPADAGIGLRLQHLAEVADASAPVAPWLEIHSETFLNPGGPRLAMITDVRGRHPLSCHGVGLSLGSAQGLDPQHLKRLRHLFDRLTPALVSEHLAWSVVDGAYLNDLLPLPLTTETLDIVTDNVTCAQDAFGRQILIENPSSYLTFADSTLTEWDFLAQLTQRTGCGLLLDINNIFVSAANNGFDAATYLSHVPFDAVQEIHLAGHSIEDEGESRVLIDTHSTHVCDPVWVLYESVVSRYGARPTLIEWDMDIPTLDTLRAEAHRAQTMLDAVRKESRVHVA